MPIRTGNAYAEFIKKCTGKGFTREECEQRWKLKSTGLIYGLQQLGWAVDQGLKRADTLRPVGFLGQPISFWGDVVGTLVGVLGGLYLPEPYDITAAMIGGRLSTNLWDHAARLVPLRVATPPLVYTPPGTVITPQAVAKGRYVMA